MASDLSDTTTSRQNFLLALTTAGTGLAAAGSLALSPLTPTLPSPLGAF